MSIKTSVVKTNKHSYAILQKAENPQICISTLQPIIREDRGKLSEPLFSLLTEKYNNSEISFLTYQYILKKFSRNTKSNNQQNLRILSEYSIESGFSLKGEKMFFKKS